eukprot:TRINITY_DN35451_c0_g1_i1.p1 TRINITY_DN35451_c0_g1~~TRINITY_DN35451_c0_g1_i1.p1  ORF type:complete len:620 (-),score=31.92 TRINITY_DN35451_c0_g1_i1:13-1872(-)
MAGFTSLTKAAALAFLLLTASAQGSWNTVDIPAFYCENRASNFSITPEASSVTLPHVVAFQRETCNAIQVTFSVRDAVGAEVIPSTTVNLADLCAVVDAPTSVPSDAACPSRRLLARYGDSAPPRRMSARRRGGGSRSPSTRSPPPRRRRAPVPVPRRRGITPRRRSDPLTRRRTPRPPSTETSSIARRRSSAGISGQTYSARRRGGTYGYGTQSTLNSNYGGRPPAIQSYGYSGQSLSSRSRMSTGAMVAGGFAGGLIVGASAMYFWNRMTSVRPRFRNRLQNTPAHSGDVTISLLWDTTDDLDLHVVAPNGQTIYSRNRRSSDGGWLDVDQNVRHDRNDPIENVAWDRAPLGTYSVRVKFFSRGSTSGPTNFEILLRAVPQLSAQQWPSGSTVDESSSSHGTMVFFQGQISDTGATFQVFNFEVTNRAVRTWCLGPQNTAMAGEMMDCQACADLASQGGSACCQVPQSCLSGSSGCNLTLRRNMNRDDVMNAVFTPHAFVAPFTISVENATGVDYNQSALCPLTASSPRLYVDFTALDTIGCDVNVGSHCSSESDCYDNEICEGTTCVCHDGACLSDGVCVETDAGQTGTVDGAVTDQPYIVPLLLMFLFIFCRRVK